jgi:hypothetical protein
MPTTTVTTFPTIDQEPVTLAQLRAQVREYSENAGVVELLTLKLQAARDTCERYCGRFFASCVAQATYEVGEPYVLPAGAGEVTAVTGYYTTLDQLTALTDTGYLTEYVKGISISRDYPIGFDGYGARTERPTFAVTFPVDVPADKVPPAVKEAILKLAAELYENRETSGANTVLLPVSYRTLLQPYCLTNPMFQ